MPQPSSPYTSLPTGDTPQHCARPLHHDIGRRSFLGLLGAGATSLAISPAWAADPLPRPVATGDAALARLMAGNARWAAGKPEARDPMAGRDARARAQYPIAAIMSCAWPAISPMTTASPVWNTPSPCWAFRW
jgi:carbonic anhydrase